MAYKDNWLRHLFAGITADHSKELQKDFWSTEDIWDPCIPVKYRWWKMLWVQFASVIASIIFPALTIYLFYGLVKGFHPLRFMLIFTIVATVVATLIFMLVEIIFYIHSMRARK